MEHDFYQRMVNRIKRRYRATADKSLRDVYALDAAFLKTGEDAEFTIRNREKIAAVLADPDLFERLVQVFLNHTIFLMIPSPIMQVETAAT